jgi:hypothetical protein
MFISIIEHWSMVLAGMLGMAIVVFLSGVGRSNARDAEQRRAAAFSDLEAECQRLTELRNALLGMADVLAAAIGNYFGESIGEHSDTNCPWQNAIKLLATPRDRSSDLKAWRGKYLEAMTREEALAALQEVELMYRQNLAFNINKTSQLEEWRTNRLN